MGLSVSPTKSAARNASFLALIVTRRPSIRTPLTRKIALQPNTGQMQPARKNHLTSRRSNNLMIAIPVVSQIPPWLLLTSGALLGWLRNFWTRFYNSTIGQVIQRITVSVTVEEMDHAEAWIWLQFWAEKRLQERRISALLLRRTRVSRDPYEEKMVECNGTREIGYELTPAYGVYPFIWKHRYFMIFDSGEDKGTPQTSGASSMLLCHDVRSR